MNENKINQKNTIHKVLAYSYTFYFIIFLAGITLDFIFKFKIFKNFNTIPTGLTVLFLGTFLILWAQHTSHHLEKENLNKDSFCHGPYRYTRSPTHWGLFLLMLGFGLMANATFVILFSFVAMIFTKLTFIQKEEKMLAEKYGQPYLDYKKEVKL